MTGVNYFPLAVFTIFALTSFHVLVSASDPGPLQDFCVAINNASSFSQFAVFVNGKVCKDPKLATADDFFFSGLKIPKSTENAVGSTVTPANVEQIAGLNTLGISQARIDFAPNGGLNPPHYHPRASEILLVLEGTLNVGFITSNPEHRLISKVLNKGDVFVFPNGLIHFQLNTGPVNAVAIASFSSQNPGVITVAKTIFGSNPPINADILSKAFQIDNKLVGFLQKQFSDSNK